MIVFLIIVFLFFSVAFLFGFLLSSPVYKGPKTDHFNGKRFRNPSGVPANGFKDVFKFIRSYRPEKTYYNADAYVRSEAIPLANDVPESKSHIIFINHSSFLIQQDGINVLTDPIWSKRCSPFQFMGPSRLREAGVKFESLPSIDLVLISHNHYDHLDRQTVINLKEKHDPTFVVPLGVDLYLNKLGIQKTIALDWFDSTDFMGIKVTATPANHFSSRGTFDRDQTLWCGFSMRSKYKHIYFVGDTGYSPMFEEIREKIGEIDFALIPIGAYKPEWFMGPIHIDPPQAIKVHQEIKSPKSMAMHFGTFPLAEDAPATAIDYLKSSLKESQISEEEFIIPTEGVSYYV